MVSPLPNNKRLDHRRSSRHIPAYIQFLSSSSFFKFDIRQGYVGIIVIIIAQSVVWLHQRQYRKENGLEEPKYSVVFFDITRDKADEGLISCTKFLINYAFYKFGLEVPLYYQY